MSLAVLALAFARPAAAQYPGGGWIVTDQAGADGSRGGMPLVTGRHLLRVPVDPNTGKAQVSLGGTATATADVPYGVMGNYPGTT